MKGMAAWREVESRVHRPGHGLALAIGVLVLAMGVVGVWKAGDVAPKDLPLWIPRIFLGMFAMMGGLVCLAALRGMLWPARVRHAESGVLPHVPTEPVTREGSTAHGRLTHELVEVSSGWEFRPRQSMRRHDLRFLFGFGVPFLTFFAAMLSWVFHTQLKIANWPGSILAATGVTLLCGGSALAIMGCLMNWSFRKLAGLKIPREGDLELDIADKPQSGLTDLAAGLTEIFQGDVRRVRLTIPRARVLAVQLCPWKVVLAGAGDRSTTWAVQGLLVLSHAAGDEIYRLPLLLTSDFVGAARLMRDLADVLRVPYLYHADAAGWEAENQRSGKREPLRTGGIVS